jgi:hypothetical protein
MISISATPSDEYIHILATQKGYQDTVQAPVEKEESYESCIWLDGVEIPAGTRTITVWENVNNPQSKEDFLRQVFEGIIKNDVSIELIRHNNQMKEEARIAEENAIREAVASSITSSIWN